MNSVLQAVAGSGKSMLLHGLALLWACGKRERPNLLSEHFDCVLLVSLGNISSNMTVMEYLETTNRKVYNLAFPEQQTGPRVLLLLDAYDEALTPGASFALPQLAANSAATAV